jgi:hypothetical protein
MRCSSAIPLAALLLAQLSCAAVGLTPVRQTMPAARLALAPEYRVFYDALEDYGDWTLIEPYGYVFRPDVNFVAWRPYEDGFWVPTDVYGWVWVSAEPFGWATYHYGRWFNDRYQGWVWTPGLDWGPAWVAWEQVDDYVGWAPLAPSPRGTDPARIPGGGFTFVPLSQLAATDLKSRLVQPAQIEDRLANARPIKNFFQREGVTINRGPDLTVVENVTGTLPRVDLTETPEIGGLRRTGAAGRARDAEDQLDATRRAAEQAATQARKISEQGLAPPARLPLLRPVAPPAPGTGRRAPARGRGGAADSTAH